MNNDSYKIICGYMPQHIRFALESVKESEKSRINEIRLRADRGIALYNCTGALFLCSNGRLTSDSHDSEILIIGAKDIGVISDSLCRYSVHSSRRELSQCFFTIEKGIRVGAAGSFTDNGSGLKFITSLNFRISRELIGISDELYKTLLLDELKSILICGGVNSGKTTMLRDLCRKLGQQYKTVLIDERNELSASVNGIPTTDIGYQTDVLSGCRRSDGIMTAVRVLSPQIIICDEIASNDDCQAIVGGFGSGVNFISSIHAASYQELLSRETAQKLISKGVFDYAVIMEGEAFPGKIKEIRRLKNDFKNSRVYHDSLLRGHDR